MIEPNPYQFIRAKLYAEVYAAWSKAWAENCHLHGAPAVHATRALEAFDQAIDTKLPDSAPDAL